MAQTEHLPIYKAAFDLCLHFEQVVRNFSRYHKYSIGQDLRDIPVSRTPQESYRRYDRSPG